MTDFDYKNFELKLTKFFFFQFLKQRYESNPHFDSYLSVNTDLMFKIEMSSWYFFELIFHFSPETIQKKRENTFIFQFDIFQWQRAKWTQL